MAHGREDHAAGMGRRGALARLGWGAGMPHRRPGTGTGAPFRVNG
jgi:hypothetical protein